MCRWLLGLGVALVAASVSGADEKAEAVVKKAIEAHGGADNLNKYKAGKLKMTGDLSVLGMNAEFTGTMSFSMPDRYKLTLSTEIMGQKMDIEQVVKGETVKSVVKVGDMTLSNPGGESEKDELRMAAVLQDAEQITPLLDAKKFGIKVDADEDVNGKKAAVIVVQPKAVKKEIKMYFDKSSGLLVKTAHKGTGPGDDGQPKEVNEETYAEDYKKIKGIQVPMKLIVNHDGKKFLTIKVGEYEVLEKIDDKEFTTDD